MADDLKNRGPADRARVNINEDHEVAYWCKEFRCTEADLREAVKTTRTVMADDIRTYLAARRTIAGGG